MSNSPLVVYTKISPNSTNPRNNTIKKITIHHMAGNISVETCANVFAPTTRQASSNYGVGTDGRIAMYVEEKNRAWTSSSPANDNQAVTIEVANDETGGNWHVSDKALEATITLCVDICKRNSIAKLIFTGDATGNLTQHNYFAATGCPGPYLKSKFQYIADEVNERLGITAPQPIPEGSIPIIGASAFSIGQAETWAKKKDASDTFISLAQKYWDYALDHGGVNPSIAFCQAALETGYGKFGGVLNATYCNPCGLKTKTGSSDTDPGAHQRFISWEEGVKAHLDHLALYAGAASYPRAVSLDPRHFSYLLGKGKTLEEMSKGWCPGNAKYAAVLKGMLDEVTSGDTSSFSPYTVRVTASVLNIRKGPGTNSKLCGSIKNKGVYTIVEEATGPGATKWGKLKSGAGWIALDFTQKA